jgi:excisionase family DNA binding protein
MDRDLNRRRLEVERTDREELTRDIERSAQAGVEAVLSPHSEALHRFIQHAYLFKTWFSLDEAARYASISKRTLKKWREDGLSESRVRGSTYIKREELDDYIASHC